MDILTKIITFWLFWTSVLWIISQIQYKFYDGYRTKDEFFDNNLFYRTSLISFFGGCIVFAAPVIFRLASWWFKL